MADHDEVREVASTSATKQSQEMEENLFPVPTRVDFTRLYPQGTSLRMVQTFVNGPWLDFMAAGLLVIVVWGQLWQNPLEKESLFNMVVGALVYVFFMMEMVLKVWAAQGLWRQEGGYLRDNCNKVDVVILGAVTVDYIIRVSGVDWRFSCYLMPVRLFSRDESLCKLVIEVLKILPDVIENISYLLCIYVRIFESPFND